MILLELKRYLMQQQRANLFDLSTRFGVRPDVMRDMLAVYVRKGCVRSCERAEQCGTSCARCNPLFTEVYEWYSS